MLNIYNIHIKNNTAEDNEKLNILVGGKGIAMERFQLMVDAFRDMNCEIIVVNTMTGEALAVYDGVKVEMFK